MEQQEQGPYGGFRGPLRARVLWLVGAGTAMVYGAAIAGLSGAAVGALGWAIAGLVVGRVLRPHRRRRSSPDATEAALFDQLRSTPCPVCGSPTLFELCLDCAEGRSHRHRHRGRDAPGRDEPEGGDLWP